jgi:hypothetical protein
VQGGAGWLDCLHADKWHCWIGCGFTAFSASGSAAFCVFCSSSPFVFSVSVIVKLILHVFSACCLLLLHLTSTPLPYPSRPPDLQMVAGLRINNSSAWAAFDKMEEKVMALEAEAESSSLLAAPDRLEAQFAMLEGGTVEDELAALKQGRLAAASSSSSRGGQQTQALGRPVSEVLVREPARQLDAIDAELEQLRKRARSQ